MDRLCEKLGRMLEVFAASMFSIFILSVTYQVAARYISIVPRAYWTEEISRMAFIWMVFSAAAIGVRDREHFVLDVIPVEKFRYPISLAASVFSDCVVFLISLYIVIGGISFVSLGDNRFSSASGFELIWFYLAIPTSGVIFCIFAVSNAMSVSDKITNR